MALATASLRASQRAAAVRCRLPGRSLVRPIAAPPPPLVVRLLPAASRPLRRWCSGGPGGREDDAERKWLDVVDKTGSDVVDLLISPLRHGVYNMFLLPLNIAYPGAWDAAAFKKGAPCAFRHVVERLDDARTIAVELRHAVSAELLQELQKRAEAQAKDAQFATAAFSRVVDVRVHAIFTVRVSTDDNGTEAVWVTALLDALEEYRATTDLEGDAAGWRVRRLHKWKFKRILPEENEGAYGDWVVVDMNNWRWTPRKD